MQPVVRGSLTALMLVTIFITGTACTTESSTSDVGTHSPESSSSEDTRQERANALLDYVESERAVLPKIREAFPGVYSETRVEGSLETQDGSRGLRAGEYAVVWYYYTYAQPMDWSVTMDALDSQRAELDQLCKSTIMPAMSAAGVAGPKSAVWSYSDPRSEFGPMWSHTCSQWE